MVAKTFGVAVCSDSNPRRLRNDSSLLDQLTARRKHCMEHLLRGELQMNKQTAWTRLPFNFRAIPLRTVSSAVRYKQWRHPINKPKRVSLVWLFEMTQQQSGNAVNLSQKVFFIISGASRGIGRAIAIESSSKFATGSVIVLLARSTSGLEETKAQILAKNQSNVTVLTFAIDLTKPSIDELNNVFETSLAERSPNEFSLAFIVHNIGTVGDTSKTARELGADLSIWHDYYSTNVFSVAALNTAFLAAFPGDATARKLIANITSKAGIVPFQSFGLYRYSYSGMPLAVQDETNSFTVSLKSRQSGSWNVLPGVGPGGRGQVNGFELFTGSCWHRHDSRCSGTFHIDGITIAIRQIEREQNHFATNWNNFEVHRGHWKGCLQIWRSRWLLWLICRTDIRMMARPRRLEIFHFLYLMVVVVVLTINWCCFEFYIGRFFVFVCGAAPMSVTKDSLNCPPRCARFKKWNHFSYEILFADSSQLSCRHKQAIWCHSQIMDSTFGQTFLFLTKLAWKCKVTLPILVTAAFLVMDFRMQIELNVHTEQLVLQVLQRDHSQTTDIDFC